MIKIDEPYDEKRKNTANLILLIEKNITKNDMMTTGDKQAEYTVSDNQGKTSVPIVTEREINKLFKNNIPKSLKKVLYSAIIK